MPNISRSRPANIRGLLRTTIFIMYPFRYSFSRNIPRTISSTATVTSSTFTEKNEMHITAPRNAASASRTPVVQPFLRLFGPRITPPPQYPLSFRDCYILFARRDFVTNAFGQKKQRPQRGRSPAAGGQMYARLCHECAQIMSRNYALAAEREVDSARLYPLTQRREEVAHTVHLLCVSPLRGMV